MTNVGTIYMDLVIKDMLDDGIKKAAKKAESANKQAFSGVSDIVNDAIKKPMEDAQKTISKTFEKTAEKAKQQTKDIENAIDRLIKREKEAASVDISASIPNVQEVVQSKMATQIVKEKGLENPKEQAKPDNAASPKTFELANNAAGLLEQKLDTINSKIGEQQEKLAGLLAEYEKASSVEGPGSAAAKRLDAEITNTQAKLISLQESALRTEHTISKSANKSAESVKSNASKVMGAPKKVSNAFQRMGKKIQKDTSSAFNKIKQNADVTTKNVSKNVSRVGKSVNPIKKMFTGLGRTIRSSLKSVFLFSVLYATFRGIKELISGTIAQNENFSKSLEKTKNNLAVAFTPIIQSVTPMLETLMHWLEMATQKLAEFTAKIFGTTYDQAAKAHQKMKDAADEAKKTGQTMGIDQLNIISQDDDKKEMDLAPSNTKELDTLLDKIKKKLEFITNSDFGKWAIDKASDAVQFYLQQLESWRIWMQSLEPIIKSIGASLQTAGKRAWEFWKPVLDLGWEIYKETLANINATYQNIIGTIVELVDKYLILYNTVMQFLEKIGVVEAIQKQFLNLLTLIRDMLNSFFTWINDKIDALKSAWGGILTFFTGVFSGDWKMACEGLKEAFGGVKKSVSADIDFVKNIFVSFKNFFVRGAQMLKEFISKLASQIWETINQLPFKIGKALGAAFAKLLKWWKDCVDWCKNKLPEIINSIGAWFKELPEKAKDAFNKVIEFLNALPDKAIAAGKNLIDGFWKGIKSAGKWLFEKIGGFLAGFGIGFKDEVTKMDENDPQITPVTPFASGGIVSAPTLAMVGEYNGARSNPEVIAPLSDLQSMISNSTSDESTEILNGILNVLNIIAALLKSGFKLDADAKQLYLNLQKIGKEQGRTILAGGVV